MGTDAERLAKAERAYLVAPAGFGKTYLIGEAVTGHCSGRQLLLTHTHAGVRAMRERMTLMGCPRSRYHVETISGWALRYATAYPALSGVKHSYPETSAEWRAVYQATVHLLDEKALRHVIAASYSGVFVDEYQDCTSGQHDLVLALAELLPCRILGDPLQGIFDFENDAVRWEIDIIGSFDPLPQLVTPYRWLGKNDALGSWLIEVRERLQAGHAIELRNSPAGVTWNRLGRKDHERTTAQRRTCFSRLGQKGTVAAIHEGTQEGPCTALARTLGGRFQCMEPIDSKTLFKYAEKVGGSQGGKRAIGLIDFAGTCLTKVKVELKTIRSRLDESARGGRQLRKHREILQLLEKVAMSRGLAQAAPALEAMQRIPGVALFRRELWRAFLRSLVEFQNGDYESLVDAARHVREIDRRAGYRAEYRSISRTLLIKGLEVDHAIVLDADKLDRNQLYVALTRGSRSLTVLSRQPVLRSIP